MSASLSIIVYKGDPIDACDFRHTALFLEVPGSDSILLHVVGGAGFFQAQVIPNNDPSGSKNFICKIGIAKISGQSKETIQTEITSTPIKNTDKSWNCQHWVGDVLLGLDKSGWISSTARKDSLDSMVDVIVAAPDES